MKRQLAAGIVAKEGRVLLVRAETGTSALNEMWSLPTGEIRGHESREQALLRAVAEKTGLDVQVSRSLLVHDGPESTIALFEASPQDSPCVHASLSLGSRFFAFDELPQQVLLESMLCIAKYQLITLSVGATPFSLIDRIFTSVFYSHLAPHLKRFSLTHDIDIYNYIVLTTPHRKFKSVVPFLISKCDAVKSHLFLIPELCFAVWTHLDDCHDETLQRYGQESALSHFGKRASLIALFRSLHDMTDLLHRELSPSRVAIIVSALNDSAAALQQRDQNHLDTGLETYLDQSAARTEFLRAAWVAVLEETDYDAAKRDMLYDIQRRSSQIGQLINDYFDLERGRLQDFEQRVASAHCLLLYRQASDADRVALRQLWSGMEDGRERYVALLAKYDIRRVLRQLIRDALGQMISSIAGTQFGTDEKAILIAWHQMSFVHFYQEINDVSVLSPFLVAVENLSVARRSCRGVA